MLRELQTYRDLRLFLLTLPIDHPIFDQRIQAVRPVPDDSVTQLLMPVLAIGTNFDLGLEKTKNSYSRDGGHEPEDWVFLLDSNPFGHCEAAAADLQTLELIASG